MLAPTGLRIFSAILYCFVVSDATLFSAVYFLALDFHSTYKLLAVLFISEMTYNDLLTY